MENFITINTHASHERYSSEDRCSKCGDTPHVEGFGCPASRYKCKNCHKVGHFSSLCFKKKESEYKREPKQPRAHQLMVGRTSAQSSSYEQSDTCLRLCDDSFCLQMKVKSTQAETKMQEPQHLFTNLAHKLKPQKKKIKNLRARIYTCTMANILPLSVYKLIFKDTDCVQFAPSAKVAIRTYTNEKINIIGTCSLFAVHQTPANNILCYKP